MEKNEILNIYFGLIAGVSAYHYPYPWPCNGISPRRGWFPCATCSIYDADARVPDGFLPERQVWLQVYGFCAVNMTQAEVTILMPPFRILQFGDDEHDNRLVCDDLLKAFRYE